MAEISAIHSALAGKELEGIGHTYLALHRLRAVQHGLRVALMQLHPDNEHAAALRDELEATHWRVGELEGLLELGVEVAERAGVARDAVYGIVEG